MGAQHSAQGRAGAWARGEGGWVAGRDPSARNVLQRTGWGVHTVWLRLIAGAGRQAIDVMNSRNLSF